MVENNILSAAVADDLRAMILRELDELSTDQLVEFVRITSSSRRGVLPGYVQDHYPAFPIVPFEPLP